MEQFTELTAAAIIRENAQNHTVLVQWLERDQVLEYWFPREDVVHLSRIGSQGVNIGVVSTSYWEALRDIAFRQDLVVDF